MKLLTHNMLTSHVKGVTKGYPLLIKVTANTWTEANSKTPELPELIATHVSANAEF